MPERAIAAAAICRSGGSDAATRPSTLATRCRLIEHAALPLSMRRHC